MRLCPGDDADAKSTALKACQSHYKSLSERALKYCTFSTSSSRLQSVTCYRHASSLEIGSFPPVVRYNELISCPKTFVRAISDHSDEPARQPGNAVRFVQLPSTRYMGSRKFVARAYACVTRYELLVEKLQ